jgi:EmrB/QacA subfamily drug resistance transporter
MLATPQNPPLNSDSSPWPILLVISVGTLLTAVAGSIAPLILPELCRDLGISFLDSRWVVLAFLLTMTVLLLLAGRACDLLGLRTVYLLGFVLFGGMSLMGGLAQSFWLLIVSRVLQAAGGAMILSAGPALLTTSFPPEKRGQALGLSATATYIGLTIGPTLGGFIISTLNWRWTFFINVPIALITTILGLVFLPKNQPRQIRSVDWLGMATWSIGLTLCLLVITKGTEWGVHAFYTWGSLLVGVTTLVAFLAIELRQKEPLLTLALFRQRLFTGATVSALCNYIATFVHMILMPFFLKEGINVAPDKAGLVLSSQPLMMALVASPFGILSDRIGSRGLATIGMLIMAGGLIGLCSLGAASSVWDAALWYGVIGVGTGVFISPNSSALMGSVPRMQQGLAAGIMAITRNLGMLIGAASATAIYQFAGGNTGRSWIESDYHALRTALQLSVLVALIGAVSAALRGRKNTL